MPQPLIDLGGDPQQPTLHLALANGFVPQTYLPLLRPLRDEYHAVCLLPRALWGAGDPPPVTPEQTWQVLADDLVAGFAQYDLQDVIAIGHSFGGIASLLAVLKDPSRFKALILLDPTILSAEICEQMRAAQAWGTADQHPLAQLALRRRAHFASVENAYERFRGKRLFADWPDEAVRLYAQHGTQPCADGDGRCLTWSPAWEAFYFMTGYVDIWQDVPRLADVDVPMLFLAGAESDTYLPASAAKVRDLVPNATHMSIAGYGHLFPQAAPEQTASVIQTWLQQL